MERSDVDAWAERKEKPVLLVADHIRGGNGKFRILSVGDRKPLQDLRIEHLGGATINEGQDEG